MLTTNVCSVLTVHQADLYPPTCGNHPMSTPFPRGRCYSDHLHSTGEQEQVEKAPRPHCGSAGVEAQEPTLPTMTANCSPETEFPTDVRNWPKRTQLLGIKVRGVSVCVDGIKS